MKLITNRSTVYLVPSSSVASFLVLGGGGKTPKCTDTNIYVLILRERAKRASASETYVFRTQNTSAYIYIQSMQFPLITYKYDIILAKH